MSDPGGVGRMEPDPESGGWRFLDDGEHYPPTPRQMPAGAVLVNEPWNCHWVLAPSHPDYDKPVEWSIYVPPYTHRRWGIPHAWAMDLLRATGQTFHMVPRADRR